VVDLKWVKDGRYQIIYLDHSNNMSSRYIKVIHEREYVLLAYCYEKCGIRSFLKEGILGVKKLEERRDWLPTRTHQ
jgi:hypothetical protein